jgi:hypothetical protein
VYFQVTISVVVFNPRYERELARLAPRAVPPEFRLETTLIAAPIYAAAFFWFGYDHSVIISLQTEYTSDGRLTLPFLCGRH